MTTAQNVILKFGTSDFIGLSNVITSTGDVYRITENNVTNINDANVNINVPFSKIRFETAYSLESRDFHIWYRVRRSPYR